LSWRCSVLRLVACALLVAFGAPVRAPLAEPAEAAVVPLAGAVAGARMPEAAPIAGIAIAGMLEVEPAAEIAEAGAADAAPTAGLEEVGTSELTPGTRAPRGDYRSEIERAWFEGGLDPDARANRVRYRGLELGVDNVESASRALIVASRGDGGLDAARQAVQLAPDLPIAHMALARAYWSDGGYREALAETFAGLAAIPRNLEASLWLAGSLLMMLATVLVVGSLVFIVWVGISFVSHATHDVGDLISEEMPTFARAALLGSLLLVPLLLGEGLLGLVLLFFVLGFLYGGSHHRTALSVAAVLIVLGCYPVMRLAGMALTALDSDPVAAAALSVTRAVETPAEVELLRGSDRNDLLAQHALALHVQRTAPLDEALKRYEVLLELDPEDPVVLTSVANLHFRKGQIEEAISLYERAAVLIDSAVVMFDLAQAHARSFQMEQFEGAMSKAQSIDAEDAVLLSHSGDPDFLANLPLPRKGLRDRMLRRARGDAFVQPVRRALMPGRLGQSWPVTAGAFALVALLSLLSSGRYEHSSTCERCGRRICSRCDGTVWNSEICEGCHHLFHRPQATEPELRMARLAELRERETRLEKVALAASLLVPGVAGLLARRPGLGFVGLLLFAWAAVAFAWRQGVVPDPLALGSAGPLAFFLTGLIAVLGYLVVLAIGLAVQRSS